MSHTIADAGNQGHAQNWKYDQIDHLGNGMSPGLSPPDNMMQWHICNYQIRSHNSKTIEPTLKKI